jgi:hypothetical protein
MPDEQLNISIFDSLRAKVMADEDATGLFTGEIYNFPFLGVPAARSPALAIVEDGFMVKAATRGGPGNSQESITLFGSLQIQVHEPAGARPEVIAGTVRSRLYRLQRILRRYARNVTPYWQNLRINPEQPAIYGRDPGKYQVGVIGFIVDSQDTAPD